jgi:Xaa-Pro aminopeptidase
VVAVDPSLISAPSAKKLSERIQRSGGSELLPLETNLVDLCWGSDRPDPPSNTVTTLPDKFSGKDVQAKLSELRRELAKKNSMGFVVSALDEVAWLFNLRGSDIPYNPVFFSYAVVTPTTATLYINKQQLDANTLAYLESNGVLVKPYGDLFTDVRKLCDAAKPQETAPGSPCPRFHISTKASWALKLALGGDENVEEVRSPISDAKAIKNDTEMDGMRACHVRDGAALIEFFAWLEDQLVDQKAILDEVDAADKLEELRRQQRDYVGLSFSTISSTGAK